ESAAFQLHSGRIHTCWRVYGRGLELKDDFGSFYWLFANPITDLGNFKIMRHEKERTDSSFAGNGRSGGRLNEHSRSYRFDATVDCSGRQNFFAKKVAGNGSPYNYFNGTTHRLLNWWATVRCVNDSRAIFESAGPPGPRQVRRILFIKFAEQGSTVL